MKSKKIGKKWILFIMVVFFGRCFAQENLLKEPVSLDENNQFGIEAEAFENITNGYNLNISYKWEKGEKHFFELNAGEKSPLAYGIYRGATAAKNVVTPEKKSGKVSYVVVARDVSALKKNGLLIKGNGIKITKILCEPAPVEKKKTKAIKAEIPNIKITANPVPVYPKDSPVDKHGKLKVNGAYLYDKNGEKFMLYGMSTHGLAWYPQYVNQNGFKTLYDDWNTNCVRLALYVQENGGYCAGGNQEHLKNLIFKGIDAATELGMYVIVDWHVLNFNPNYHLDDAMLFFSEISQKYAKYDNVIYELCNEPTGSPWTTVLTPYAENLIPMIRKNAPDSLVIVGTNTWSQDIHDAALSPLKYKNVMYAFHFYADTHRDSFRDRVESCIENGLPVFITEFGTCNASGNGGFNVSQTGLWLDLIKKYNISHMNWSLANKAETASVIASGCSKISDWDYEDLSDSGKLIYNHFRTLKQ
ncbi:MAG: glycoside hydrolase family 5 protein [Treponema sp.]|nr:glycoside hydrolase family 5 protein [Treponema sp.]